MAVSIPQQLGDGMNTAFFKDVHLVRIDRFNADEQFRGDDSR